MEYSGSVEAKQGTERSVLVLPKSVHDDTMRYSTPIQAEDNARNSTMVVEAKQGTERSVLVLPKYDAMRYSIPIQAEDDGRISMLVASIVHLNNTR